MLSLLITSKFIAYPIPSLPNGLGNVFVLFEIFIILFSFIFGVTTTLITGLIYYGIIAWVGQPFFIREIIYVKGIENILGVYFLDYVIPFIFFACSSLVYQKIKRNYIAILSIALMVICAYFSSVISGIIFWSAYNWHGWSLIAYSLAANSIRFGVMLFIGIFFIGIIIMRLNVFVKYCLGENYARY